MDWARSQSPWRRAASTRMQMSAISLAPSCRAEPFMLWERVRKAPASAAGSIWRSASRRRGVVCRKRSSTSRTSARRPWPDRKSTRLNSSHLGISYAVFCLKKKKKSETNNEQLTGKKGYFKTRVVLAAKSDGRGKSTRQTTILEQAGERDKSTTQIS